MLSITNRGTCAIAIALVLAAPAAAGCGGSAAGGASTTTSSPASSEREVDSTQTTQAAPQVDPAVARWARKWKHKVGKPTRWAAARLATNAPLAVAGSSAAYYRLTAAFNVLSNCRLPLETSMAATPQDMQQARKMTKAACRMIYVGTDRVIQGLNAQSAAGVGAGIQRVRQGLALLMRAGHEVDRAATPR
ncbi:MAG TPA: hypothetical protein VFW18_00945 [Gaiellales bacterium]|nr:hypothetical protein [Gaiellales bacterium]